MNCAIEFFPLRQGGHNSILLGHLVIGCVLYPKGGGIYSFLNKNSSPQLGEILQRRGHL